ncbi:hypothetical protein TUM12131_51110 (plasmid) [Klebsiella pneumoniae]|nr:hypothetical protein TUM12131_51110 [Klebsiella pneumoniae]
MQRKVYCTIHNRLSLKAQESEKAESPGIIDKEFFNKIGEDFNPKKFNKKF